MNDVVIEQYKTSTQTPFLMSCIS